MADAERLADEVKQEQVREIKDQLSIDMYNRYNMVVFDIELRNFINKCQTLNDFCTQEHISHIDRQRKGLELSAKELQAKIDDAEAAMIKCKRAEIKDQRSISISVGQRALSKVEERIRAIEQVSDRQLTGKLEKLRLFCTRPVSSSGLRYYLTLGRNTSPSSASTKSPSRD